MLVTKSSLFLGSVVIKPALEDQEVWGNRCVARQGKFVLERSCVIAIHENKVISYDYWATDGRKDICLKEIEQTRNCDTPTSLPLPSSASQKKSPAETLSPASLGSPDFV